MTDEAVKKRLEALAVLMRQPGTNVEKLSEEIDRLLGTKLHEEDKSMAGAWERSRRRK
jgi:hypothetical protein